jgi:tight adherence protein C
MENIMVGSAGFTAGAAVTALILAMSRVAYMLDGANRTGMDTPPGFMTLVWPLIKLIDFFVAANLPIKVIENVDSKLQKNGVSFAVTPGEFISSIIVFLTLFPALGWLAMSSSGSPDVTVLVLLALVGAVLPQLWMRDTRTKRNFELVRNLPVYLEYLSMCVDAGLNFAGALKQSVDKGPKGAMRNEFRIVLRDINSGETRADALTRLEKRVDLSDISIFVRAVIQAERMGSSMKETLVIQAEQRLTERFQRAEKMAMEAPVKLVVPLVVFIFPLTFIILLFPIVVRFMEQGTF